MPIREVGFQLRDQSTQLQLEWDVNQRATFLVDAAGDLDLALTGGVFNLAAMTPEFHISPDTNENVVIRANTAGTGFFRLDSAVNNIQLSIADATIMAFESGMITAFGTFDITGGIVVNIGGVETDLITATGDLTITPVGDTIFSAGDVIAGGNDGILKVARTSGGQFHIRDLGSISDADILNFISFRDAADAQAAFLGFGSSSSTDFTIDSSIGDIVFQPPIGGVVKSDRPFVAPSGAEAAPSFTFNGDLGTGMNAEFLGVLAFSSTSQTLMSLRQGEGTLRLPEVGVTEKMRIIEGVAGSSNIGFYQQAVRRAYIQYSNAAGLRYQTELDQTHDFRVAGNTRLTVRNTSVQAEVPFYAPNGSSGAPGVTFALATNAGMYNSAGGPAFSVGGFVGRFTAVGLEMINGSAANPCYTFNANPDTGMYTTGTNLLFGVTAALQLTLSTTAATFNQRVRSHVGSAGAPTYSFNGDENTGMYSQGADSIGFSAGGGERVRITNVGIRINDGTAAAPTLVFIAASTTGFHRESGTGRIGMGVGGAGRFFVGVPNTTFANLEPGLDGSYDLGTTILRYRTLYVDTIVSTNPVAFSGLTVTGAVDFSGATNLAVGAADFTPTTMGFFGTPPVVKQAAVPVNASGIHAALVAYGLIS